MIHIPAMKNYRSSKMTTIEELKELHSAAKENPDSFWLKQSERLDWFQKPAKASNVSFQKPVHIEWFSDGKINASVNCIDRHLANKKNQTAILWEPDNPNEASRKISYQELYECVCQLANALLEMGVKKGERVTLYMPMVPEAAYAMLACARIGAIHSVVFGGFSPKSIAGRIKDCKSDYVLTADFGYRGGKKIPLKANVDEALELCPNVKKVLVLYREKRQSFVEGRDLDWQEWVYKQSKDHLAEAMDAEDPLFILYTSGSTGKPKGVLHTTGGYLTYAAFTHEKVFDYQEGDIYWCTADVGWITGHSYIVYGPLANGATTLMFEGVPSYPDYSRHWQIVDKYQVNTYYTAPTAIRAMMCHGEEPVKKTQRDSLRLLGSVGEPINPEAWKWYFEKVGNERCPIVDTWWQTETGGILISPLPAASGLKAGSASQPLPGIDAVLLDTEGNEIDPPGEGFLCLKSSWPGQMRSLYGDHQRFEETYFSNYPGYYFAGDACKIDADGFYWITGRVDDVLNVSGHRLGTAEIESALVAHPKVAEAAVVGYLHEIKGEGIYSYVLLNEGESFSESLQTELCQWVRKEMGPIATPDVVHFVKALPKTRSGKIMRRILRKIAKGQTDDFGDLSTLAEPDVLTSLLS